MWISSATEEIHSGAIGVFLFYSACRASSARHRGGVYAAEHMRSVSVLATNLFPLLLCWSCLCHRRRSSDRKLKQSTPHGKYDDFGA